MIFNIGGGTPAGIVLPTFTGQWTGIKGDVHGGDWEAAFFSEGDFAFASLDQHVDIFLVGTGDTNDADDGYGSGGHTGANYGGYLKTISDVHLGFGPQSIHVVPSIVRAGFSVFGEYANSNSDARYKTNQSQSSVLGQYAFNNGAGGGCPNLTAVEFNGNTYNFNAETFGDSCAVCGYRYYYYIEYVGGEWRTSGLGSTTPGSGAGPSRAWDGGAGGNATFFGCAGGHGGAQTAGGDIYNFTRAGGTPFQGVVIIRNHRS